MDQENNESVVNMITGNIGRLESIINECLSIRNRCMAVVPARPTLPVSIPLEIGLEYPVNGLSSLHIPPISLRIGKHSDNIKENAVQLSSHRRRDRVVELPTKKVKTVNISESHKNKTSSSKIRTSMSENQRERNSRGRKRNRHDSSKEEIDDNDDNDNNDDNEDNDNNDDNGDNEDNVNNDDNGDNMDNDDNDRNKNSSTVNKTRSASESSVSANESTTWTNDSTSANESSTSVIIKSAPSRKMSSSSRKRSTSSSKGIESISKRSKPTKKSSKSTTGTSTSSTQTVPMESTETQTIPINILGDDDFVLYKKYQEEKKASSQRHATKAINENYTNVAIGVTEMHNLLSNSQRYKDFFKNVTISARKLFTLGEDRNMNPTTQVINEKRDIILKIMEYVMFLVVNDKDDSYKTSNNQNDKNQNKLSDSDENMEKAKTQHIQQHRNENKNNKKPGTNQTYPNKNPHETVNPVDIDDIPFPPPGETITQGIIPDIIAARLEDPSYAPADIEVATLPLEYIRANYEALVARPPPPPSPAYSQQAVLSTPIRARDPRLAVTKSTLQRKKNHQVPQHQAFEAHQVYPVNQPYNTNTNKNVSTQKEGQNKNVISHLQYLNRMAAQRAEMNARQLSNLHTNYLQSQFQQELLMQEQLDMQQYQAKLYQNTANNIPIR